MKSTIHEYKKNNKKVMSKNSILKIATFLIFAMSIMSCSKDNDLPTPLPLQVSDVFAAGSDNSTPPQVFYYKNNVKTILPVASNENATIRGIAVDGNDVYTIGNIRIDVPGFPSTTNACYWKNNVKFILPLPSGTPINSFLDTRAITIVNGEVYIVGFSATNGSSRRTIVVWKNGIASNFASSATLSYTPSAISVYNNDVYVAGYTSDAVRDNVVFWKNGLLTTISTLDNDALDIAVNQNGIHVLYNEDGGGTLPDPIKFWKDGNVSTITTLISQTGKMAVKGTDVYITGGEIQTGSSNFKAFYWKNGVKLELPDSDRIIASDIKFGINGDIYIASKSQFNGLKELTYWKNNVKFTIGNSNERFEAFDINNK